MANTIEKDQNIAEEEGVRRTFIYFRKDGEPLGIVETPGVEPVASQRCLGEYKFEAFEVMCMPDGRKFTVNPKDEESNSSNEK